MIGNDLLLDRIMKAHHERLLSEAEARRRAGAARRRSVRGLAARTGDTLVALGERLRAGAPRTPERAAGRRRPAPRAHGVSTPLRR